MGSALLAGRRPDLPLLPDASRRGGRDGNYSEGDGVKGQRTLELAEQLED